MTATITRRTSSRQRWVLVLCAIASLMVALDVTAISTALESIRRGLGASVNELEWTVNAYNLSFAVLLITAAALGDRLGRRRLFAVGMGIFVAASAASALAPNVTVLIAARAVQGVGAALVAPLSLALLSAAFPPERRGWALGLYGGITGLAVLGGPVIGGAVTQGLAWQWVFWLNVPIGLAAIPLILRRIEESYGPRARLDVIGLALVTASTFGIVWGLMRANDAGWGSFEVIGSLAGGIVALIAFIAFELRTREPMLPMRLFRSRSFSAGSATNFLLSSALFGAVFFMAQFLQISLGNGPLASGLRLLPWTGCLFIVAPIAGSLVDRIGERPLIVLGLTLQAIGFGWVALIATAGTRILGDGAAADDRRRGDLDVDSRRPERGRERGRRRRDRQGIGDVLDDAPARRRVRGGAGGRGLLRRRQLRVAAGVRERLLAGAVGFGGPLARRCVGGDRDPGTPGAQTDRGVRAAGRHDAGSGSDRRAGTMKRTIVRYRVKPDRVAENEALVRAVYAELHDKRPDGIAYATYKLADGVTFVHIARSDLPDGSSAPLTELAAFQEFTREVRDRCDEPPVVLEASEIGRFLDP